MVVSGASPWKRQSLNTSFTLAHMMGPGDVHTPVYFICLHTVGFMTLAFKIMSGQPVPATRLIKSMNSYDDVLTIFF